MRGYLHPDYANSLSEFGWPYALKKSRGYILRRSIPDDTHFDAMGCYPLFACNDWMALNDDLEEIGKTLVCISVVTDPFGEYDKSLLKSSFRDVVMPFKKHYVINLKIPLDSYISSHHQRNVRRALQFVYVEKCKDPVLAIDEWTKLYDNLITRHSIRGIQAFSPRSFAKQLRVPGIVAFQAKHKDAIVGMLLWYLDANIGYYHLGAYSPLGYEVRASFALFYYAISYFVDIGLDWLNLGAGAGTKGDDTDGLSRFKRGWSTGTRTAWFCGRIFDKKIYAELQRARGYLKTDFFPAYRAGEYS